MRPGGRYLQEQLVKLVKRLDEGVRLIEQAQARGDTAEEDRLLGHWRKLDDQYRAAYDAQEGE